MLTVWHPLYAQTSTQWDKTLGGNQDDNLQCLQQTSDGGYIVGGYSFSGSSSDKTQASKGVNDYWVVKLNADGSKAWDKAFGGSGSDNLTSLQQTSDGGYILGGISNSDMGGDKTQASKGANDYWVVKLDAAGNKVWDKTFGGPLADNLYSIKQTRDGGYMLGGQSNSGIGGDKSQASKGDIDYWVVKLYADGSKAWDKTFGGNGPDQLRSLQQTTDGGYILGGYSNSGIGGDKTQSSRGLYDYWVVKLYSDGSKAWDKTLGGSGQDQLKSLQQTSDEGYILGGDSYSPMSGDKSEVSKSFSEADYWVVKLYADGAKAWDKTIGGSGQEALNALQQTSDGGYLLGGYSYSGIGDDKTQANKGSSDYWLVKLYADGAKAWDKTFGGSGQEALNALQQTSDGGYLLGGYSYSGIGDDKTQASKGSNDYWVLKLAESNLAESNTAPEVAGQNLFMKEGETLPIQLSGTDSDLDPLTFTVTNAPAFGTLSGTAPNLSYTPAPGYFGPDAFTFTASDGKSTSLPATVSVAVHRPAVHRINAGGPQLTNSIGVFAADKFFSPAPGRTFSTTNQIYGTPEDALYQTERYSDTNNGSFSYALPVDNGKYTVVLHFAELYWGDIRQRIFDVKAEGILRLDNYDIYYKAGGARTAITESLVVNVTDGTLDLLFSALASEGGVNRPKVSAIEVIPFEGTNALPVTNAGPDQTITLPASSLVLQGGGTDTDGTISSYSWQQVSGPNAAVFSSTAVAAPTVSGLVAGTYVFSLAVNDDQQVLSTADQVTITVKPDPTVTGGAVHRINAGGNQVTNAIGTFAADQYFSNGWGETWNRTSHFTNQPIAGTDHDAIYQSYRTAEFDNGSFRYDLPVGYGQYTVVLHFAEHYWNAAGQRVFDVALEGMKVLDNYDIVKKAGGQFTATSESFLVQVTDGSLRISLDAAASEGGVNRPAISAIEVISFVGTNSVPVANAGDDQTITLPTSGVELQGGAADADGTISSYAWSQVSGPAPATFSNSTAAAPTVSELVAGSYVFSLVVKDDKQALSAADQVTVTVNLGTTTPPSVTAGYRINAGGPQLSTATGIFVKDNYFSPTPGFTYATTQPIAGTPDGALYQTERASNVDNGSFSYAFPLSSGPYTVVLHFAELYWNAPGQRVFDVQAEGALVLDNYDIVKTTGAKFTATTESFVVDVTDGTLDLLFSALASEGGINRPKVSAIEVIPFQANAQARVALTGSGNPSQLKSGAGQGLAVSAYPNPFQQQINLKMDGAAAGTYRVRVLDLLGKQLYQAGFTAGPGTGPVHTIHLAGKAAMAGGLYLVAVEQVDGSFRQVIKMLKE